MRDKAYTQITAILAIKEGESIMGVKRKKSPNGSRPGSVYVYNYYTLTVAAEILQVVIWFQFNLVPGPSHQATTIFTNV